MSKTLPIYKIEAQGDTLYVGATGEDQAYQKLMKLTGPIPRSLLTFTVVSRDQVPAEDLECADAYNDEVL